MGDEDRLRMTIVGFHHVGIVVPNLKQAERFYCEVFELEVIGRFEMDTTQQDWVSKVTGLEDAAGKAVQLKGKNGFLELFEFTRPTSKSDDAQDTPTQRGFAHIAFQVTGIDQALKRLIEAGWSSHGPPHPVGKAIAIYCRDPFGNTVELLEFVKDDAPFDLKTTCRG